MIDLQGQEHWKEAIAGLTADQQAELRDWVRKLDDYRSSLAGVGRPAPAKIEPQQQTLRRINTKFKHLRQVFEELVAEVDGAYRELFEKADTPMEWAPIFTDFDDFRDALTELEDRLYWPDFQVKQSPNRLSSDAAAQFDLLCLNILLQFFEECGFTKTQATSRIAAIGNVMRWWSVSTNSKDKSENRSDAIAKRLARLEGRLKQAD
jgi:hypothetical protein